MPGRTITLRDAHYYHVYNRGVEKRLIFTDNKNYQRFLDTSYFYQFQDPGIRFSNYINLTPEARLLRMSSIISKPRIVNVICFVLMPNHIHFLLRQEITDGISEYMMRVADSYTKYFNIKNKRVGHLFQGKFKSVHVENDDQLKHLSRYIHLNPLTSNLVPSFDSLFAYPWSSLIEYLNGNYHVSNPVPILNFFTSIKKYAEFLQDNADFQQNLHQIKSQILEN